MFSSIIDQGLLNHLQEIDHILIDLNDIHNTRMQEQETQLNAFIQEGFIRPLSDRDGLFLITQNQLNNFYNNLNDFNKRVDNVEQQLKQLKESGLKLSQELHKQEYRNQHLQKEKQSIEQLLQEYQNTSSKIEEEEHYQGFIKSKFEEVKINLQNSKISELQDLVNVLQNQLDERNRFITQFEQNFNYFSENQTSIEIEREEEINGNNENSSNQNLIDIQQKKISLLYSQVAFYKKQSDENLAKIKNNIESRQNIFEKEIKKQQLLFSEEDENQQGLIDIQFSNSRTLQIIELQKQVYLLEEEKEKIQKEYEQYKQQTENEMIEMRSHKIEVQEYKKRLEESLKQIKQKANENMTKQQLNFEEFKSYALQIQLLNQKNENLQKLLAEEQNKTNQIQKDYDQNLEKLQNELALKSEVIRRFDPNSDIYKEQQELIQKQTTTIEQLTRDFQRAQNDKHQIEVSLNENIEKLKEENKILLCMCEQIPEIDQGKQNNQLQMILGNENSKAESQQMIANNLFKKLCDFYKQKYQSISLEYEITLSQNQQNKQEKNKLIEENNKLNQRLRQLQFTQKQNKKIQSGSKSVVRSAIKDYEPLSEDIQKILILNKQYKSNIQELQLEIVGLRSEVQSLKQMQDEEKSQSNQSSSYEDIELRPEQQDLTDQILMIEAIKKSNIFKEMFKDS